MFEGMSVAMVTPFRGGQLDLEAVAQHVDFMIDGGVQGLVVSGSTGEAATCTVEERRTLWRFVRERVSGRVPVIAGDRHERDRGQHRAHADGRGARPRRRDDRDALLQQADAASGQIAHFTPIARARSCRSCSTTCRAHRDEHAARDVRAGSGPSRTSSRSRRLRAASTRPARSRAHDVHDPLRRRFAHAADDGRWREGHDLGGRQRRAAPNAHAHATTRRRDASPRPEAIHRKLLPLFKALFIESNPGPGRSICCPR